MENKKIYIYIAVGFIAAIVVIILAVQGGFVNLGGPGPKVVNITNPETGETIEAVIPEGAAAPVNEEGQVLAPSGKVAQNDAPTGAGDSPQETQTLAPDEIPEGSLEIEVRDGSFSPASFSASTGQVVTLTFIYKLTDKSRGAHILFADPSLSGILVVLPPDTTKAITFNAPSQSGSYEFFLRGTDVKGTMVVR
jgi:hypothetical protein